MAAPPPAPPYPARPSPPARSRPAQARTDTALMPPRHILIVGGGYIALEFANIFSGLKAKVSLACRGEQVLNGFDDDVRLDITKEMHQRGITSVGRAATICTSRLR